MSERCEVLEVAPVLRVHEALSAAEWYREQLGFDVDLLWPEPGGQTPPSYAIVRRGEATLHLSATGERPVVPSQAYVFVSDVDGLAAELEARGTQLDAGPRTYPYGMREIDLHDPDGNGLTFGQGAVEEEVAP